MSFVRRLVPVSTCSRAGLALWLAVAPLAFLLGWLARGAGSSGTNPPPDPPVAATAGETSRASEASH